MNYPIPQFLMLAADLDADEISDKQIIDAMVEEFGLARKDMVRRLARLDFQQMIVDEL